MKRLFAIPVIAGLLLCAGIDNDQVYAFDSSKTTITEKKSVCDKSTESFCAYNGLLNIPENTVISEPSKEFSTFDFKGSDTPGAVFKHKEAKILAKIESMKNLKSPNSSQKINILNKTLQRYKQLYTDELFPEIPKASDVVQCGTRKDCYLLSGVMSIVDKDPYCIINMMKDNSDGTVTVRLYEIMYSKLNNMVSFKPIYCTVNKSIEKNKLSRKRLWVQMLEKAFIKSGIRSRNIEYLKGRNPALHIDSYVDESVSTISKTRDFFQIDRGFAECAMMNILGKECARITCSLINKQSNYLLGKYNNYAMGVYNKVKESIDKKSAITVSFYPERNTKLPLPSGHEYAVLGYREENNYRYIKIRDPYNGEKILNKYSSFLVSSVSYKTNGKNELTRIRKWGIGEFWVELNDFFYACRDICYQLS